MFLVIYEGFLATHKTFNASAVTFFGIKKLLTSWVHHVMRSIDVVFSLTLWNFIHEECRCRVVFTLALYVLMRSVYVGLCYMSGCVDVNPLELFHTWEMEILARGLMTLILCCCTYEECKMSGCVYIKDSFMRSTYVRLCWHQHIVAALIRSRYLVLCTLILRSYLTSWGV